MLAHLATPDLLQRRHQVQPHQLARLGHNRVALHARYCGDFAVLGLVCDELTRQPGSSCSCFELDTMLNRQAEWNGDIP